MQRLGLSRSEPMAVAVSGGADSMALLWLAKQWSNAPLTALTVDHGLRPESNFEAAQVKACCAALGVVHHTLNWQHSKPITGIQNKARNARYELMLNFCRAEKIAHLLVAHHLNDQVETMLFRLARASGLEGLRAMKTSSWRSGVWLHRPLLALPKTRLQATVLQANQPWTHDPSNDDEKYTRVHIRKQLAAVEPSIVHGFAHVAEFLKNYFYGVEKALVTTLEQCVTFHKTGHGTLAHAAFLAQPHALQMRALVYICAIISGDVSPMRAAAIERLYRKLLAGKTFTFHGCVFCYQPKQKNWLIFREYNDMAAPIRLTEKPQLWDGRFIASASEAGFVLRALGRNIAEPISEKLSASGLPKTLWPTLPAIFHLEECVFLPHISDEHNAITLHFCPSKLLADGWFFGMNDSSKTDSHGA